MSIPYLSTEWVAAADELLRAVTIEPPLPPPGFTLETVIADAAPDGPQGYVIEFDGPAMSARPPRPGEHTTLRLSQRYDVACGIARGELSAQAAFLAADIQVGGDVAVLIGNAGLIAQLGDVLAPLRERTAFDPVPIDAR